MARKYKFQGNYTCDCVMCKRAAEAEAKKGRKTLEAQLTRVGRRVVEATRAHLDAEWPSADGRIPVAAMSSSHLFFALAKAERNEYSNPDIRRHVPALRAEALRRLSGAWFPQSYHEPNAEGNYRHIARPSPRPRPTLGTPDDTSYFW